MTAIDHSPNRHCFVFWQQFGKEVYSHVQDIFQQQFQIGNSATMH